MNSSIKMINWQQCKRERYDIFGYEDCSNPAVVFQSESDLKAMSSKNISYMLTF